MMLEQAKAANRALKLSKAQKTKTSALKNLFNASKADETDS
jgi:hypothetical protein